MRLLLWRCLLIHVLCYRLPLPAAPSAASAAAIARLEDELRQCKLKHAEELASVRDECELKVIQVPLAAPPRLAQP